MPAYKAKSVTINSHQRYYRMIFEHTRGGKKRLDFLEELVTVNGSQEAVEPLAGCSIVFDPLASIQLRDPLTGDLLGRSVTQNDMYVTLYSAYRYAAELRDAEKAKLP